MLADDINIIFNTRQHNLMKDHLTNLFDLLKTQDTEDIDVTHLKAFMAH